MAALMRAIDARLRLHSGTASWWCWLRGHDAALWECRARGLEWVCPDCQRRASSAALSGGG